MASNNRRLRSEGGVLSCRDSRDSLTRTDSWIEVTPQPSLSSLSSTPAPRPQINHERLSHRFRDHAQHNNEPPRSTSATGSSQDEYEESSSESDPVLSSSNEEISKADEEDDDRTALGLRPTETVFTPPANAFSHPPTGRRSSDTYFTRPNSTPSSAIRSDRTQRTRPHLQRERTSTSSYQPDHDAALRASLTTLLSCAAAVRPKEEKTQGRQPTTRQTAQPTALRLVPESELERPRPRSPKAVKRRSRESSKERQAKKLRTKNSPINEETLSPTLTAWMISAGVVLVFSAISFSAGYAWGKEVGRIEGEMGLTGGSCGQEVARSGGGLKRLRWTSGNSSIRA